MPTNQDLRNAILVEKLWKVTQSEQAQLEVYLHRNGEMLQSIQRHIPEVPEPIESKPIISKV